MRALSKNLVAMSVAILLMIGAAGCASIPSSSSPTPIGGIPAETVINAPQPQMNADPESLVRQFFKANAFEGHGRAAGKAFLTPSAKKGWRSDATVRVIDKIDVFQQRTSPHSSILQIRASSLGVLAPDHSFEPDPRPIGVMLFLDRVDGQWRLARAPDEILVDASQFFINYRHYNLYYADPSERTMVPDPRWLPQQSPNTLAQALITRLLAGPSNRLRGAVHTAFAPNTALKRPVSSLAGSTTDGTGAIQVDLTSLGSLSDDQIKTAAAQIIWTLNKADILGPYRLLSDGRQFLSRISQWSVSDVADTNPTPPLDPDLGLHAVVNGQFMRLEDSKLVPVGGAIRNSQEIQSAAISESGRKVAFVMRNKPGEAEYRALLIGDYGGAIYRAGGIQTAASMTRPTWSPDDSSVWTVIDGRRVIKFSLSPAPGESSLVTDVTLKGFAVKPNDITDLRLSRDGVRAALIVKGQVMIGIVHTAADGAVSIENLRQVGSWMGSSASSIDWESGDTVLVGRNTSDDPVEQVDISGIRGQDLPSRNLTPPVSMVAATPSTYYVADLRGVWKVSRTNLESDRSWTAIPQLEIGMAGTDHPIEPVVQG